MNSYGWILLFSGAIHVLLGVGLIFGVLLMWKRIVRFVVEASVLKYVGILTSYGGLSLLWSAQDRGEYQLSILILVCGVLVLLHDLKKEILGNLREERLAGPVK